MSHAHRGSAAEQLLTMTHASYELRGQALMVPVPPPVSRVPRKGKATRGAKFQAFWKKKAISDYVGVLSPNGRGLAVELKSLSEEQWYLSKLPAHQADFLERWAAQGALAYLLIVYLSLDGAPRAAVAKGPAFREELRQRELLHHGLTWRALAATFDSATAVPPMRTVALDYLAAIAQVETHLAEAAAPAIEAPILPALTTVSSPSPASASAPCRA